MNESAAAEVAAPGRRPGGHREVYADPVAPSRILKKLADEDPKRPAVTVVSAGSAQEAMLTRAELDRRSNQASRLLEHRGVRQGDLVASLLGNSLEHYVATFGATKAGACILPLNPQMPAAELEQVLEVAKPRLLLRSVQDLRKLDSFDPGPVEERIAEPGVALASGGSTGRPKIIVSPGPIGAIPYTFFEWCGHRPGMRSLLPGPTFHNGPFIFSFFGLLMGDMLFIMEKFDAPLMLDLIERHRVQYTVFVPTMMRRLLAVEGVEKRDLSSLEAFVHSSAPCPPVVKRAWMDLIGPERVYEAYGASEGVGGAIIRGDEWLSHPGSVGRPYCEARIIGGDGSEVPPGAIGEVFLRMRDDGVPTYRYLGSPPASTTGDGFVSVGDLGYVDADGFLYIADRRTDLIITGGENVFPAEVEAALAEHAAVADAVVIGLPDPEWGRTVHAVVVPRELDNPPSTSDLDRHCRTLLAAYKVPRSYELSPQLDRNEAGKLRRSAMAAVRSAAQSA